MNKSLSTSDFKFIVDLVKSRSGIMLREDKVYLVESRLNQIARRYNCSSVSDLARKIRFFPNENIACAITEAMTTNESLFFRDIHPFEYLKNKIIPELIETRNVENSVKIWSAASSTGQEVYSIAMTILELSSQYSISKFTILGTDLSEEVVERAREGQYSQFEVQRGLPVQYFTKYFEKKGTSFKIKDSVKKMVSFDRFNLLESPTKFERFDIIFLRNVLIYFDIPTKRRVLNNINSVLSNDGYLILGGTESTLGITDTFENLKDSRGIYQPRDVTRTQSA